MDVSQPPTSAPDLSTGDNTQDEGFKVNVNVVRPASQVTTAPPVNDNTSFNDSAAASEVEPQLNYEAIPSPTETSAETSNTTPSTTANTTLNTTPPLTPSPTISAVSGMPMSGVDELIVDGEEGQATETPNILAVPPQEYEEVSQTASAPASTAAAATTLSPQVSPVATEHAEQHPSGAIPKKKLPIVAVVITVVAIVGLSVVGYFALTKPAADTASDSKAVEKTVTTVAPSARTSALTAQEVKELADSMDQSLAEQNDATDFNAASLSDASLGL